MCIIRRLDTVRTCGPILCSRKVVVGGLKWVTGIETADSAGQHWLKSRLVRMRRVGEVAAAPQAQRRPARDVRLQRRQDTPLTGPSQAFAGPDPAD